VPAIVTTAMLEAAVEQAGYKARRLSAATASSDDQDSERRENEARGLRRSLLIAALLTLPVFVLEMGSHLIPAMHHWVLGVLGEQRNGYLQFVLTTLVLFGPRPALLPQGRACVAARCP
jgi:P-type Cu+ transporter